MEPSSREKILEVAEARFARRGFAGVGMREVAQAAGLGKSSLFHHFPSKAALYGAVLERVVERIEAHLLPALSGEARVAERLDTAVDALVDSLSEHPTTARLLLRTLVEDDGLAEPSGFAAVEARVHDLVRAYVTLLRAGVEAAELRATASAHTVQALIGATVYHFASGEFGDAVLGAPVFSAEAVAAYRRELKQLLRSGLVSPEARPRGGPPRAPKENPPS